MRSPIFLAPSLIEFLSSRKLSRALALASLIVISGCATDKMTFLNYGVNAKQANPQSDPYTAPRVSDGLAINYANSMEIIMRTRFTGARIAREVSSTAQVAMAAFGGAGALFGYSASTIAALGLGSAAIPDLQGIFDARGRAGIYKDAAQMIRRAVIEYYAFNPRPSSTELTPNGITLVQRVSAAIELVDSFLADRLPTQSQMIQAVEGMTTDGATPHRVGDTPVNNLSSQANLRHVPDISAPESTAGGVTRPPPAKYSADFVKKQRAVANWIAVEEARKNYGALRDFLKALSLAHAAEPPDAQLADLCRDVLAGTTNDAAMNVIYNTANRFASPPPTPTPVTSVPPTPTPRGSTGGGTIPEPDLPENN